MDSDAGLPDIVQLHLFCSDKLNYNKKYWFYATIVLLLALLPQSKEVLGSHFIQSLSSWGMCALPVYE